MDFFYGHNPNPVESRWDTVHQEFFVIKWDLDNCRPYVLGRRIKVVTDHANLKWLKSTKPQQSKLARWCLAMAEYDFYIEHKPGVKHVIPDTLSRYPIDAFSVDILECPPADVTSFIATAIGFDIPYHTPDSVSALLSSSLQCLCLASNHVVTTKSTLSSISSLANMPTHPRLCKKVHSQSDSVPPTVVKEDKLFPTDDIELLQPLNRNRVDFAEAQRADLWLSELIGYISSGEKQFSLCHLSSKVNNWVLKYQSDAKLWMDYCTMMMNTWKILHIFVCLFQMIPTYNVICQKYTIIDLLVCIAVVILLILLEKHGKACAQLDSLLR